MESNKNQNIKMEIFYIQNEEMLHEGIKKLTPLAEVKDQEGFFTIGFDCEYISKVNFPEAFESARKWTIRQTYQTIVCTIQISVPQICLVIDLKNFGPILPPKLRSIIESERWSKFGVGLNGDIKYLSDNFGLNQCCSVFDLNICSKLQHPGVKKTNLDSLGKMYGLGGKTSDNSVRDWSKDLNDDLLLYAAEDANLSYKIGRILLCGNYFRSHVKDSRTPIIYRKGTEQPKQLVLSSNNPISMLHEFSQKKLVGPPVFEFSQKGLLFDCKCNFRGIETFSTDGQSKSEAKVKAAEKMKEFVIPGHSTAAKNS